MAKTRIFPVKMFGDICLVRELARKHFNRYGKLQKVNVVYAVDSEMELVKPVVIKGKQLISLEAVEIEKASEIDQVVRQFKEEKHVFYYPLDKLTYIVDHTILFHDKGVYKQTYDIYLPLHLVEKGLLCENRSIVYSDNLREMLAQRYGAFAMAHFVT